MSNAINKQKTDLLTEIRTLADQMIAISARTQTLVKLQQTFQITEQDITDGLLDGTAHDGISWAKISNVVGSMDDLLTWWGTHGVNYRAMKP